MKKFFLNIALVLGLVLALAIWVRLPWPVVLGLLALLVAWMTLSRSGRQTASVTRVGLSTLGQRMGSASVIVIGIAGVVGVLVALLAMGQGLSSTMQAGGQDNVAIVVRGGAATAAQSVLTGDDINAIKQAPGIARNAEGDALISGEILLPVNVSNKGSDTTASILMRGVDPAARAVRPQLQVVQGHWFKPGLRQVVVGRNAAVRYAGLQPGDEVQLGNDRWEVTGVFETGSGYDSEVWADRKVVASANRRGNSVSAVVARLTGAQAFDGFKAALVSDPKLNVSVSTTREYFAKQSAGLSTVIQVVGKTVGIIMAIGAVFGALNCMFAAVASRKREIATLRAIGFRGLPVVVSVMLETMVLALAGGVLGAVIVWLAFNGHTASTLHGFTQVVFRFDVSPVLLWSGIKWALAIGFIGGLFPAVRAARLPVTTALRET